jgi:peptidoglycan L-alanyl-D-glutamate endopeptidase CwlK
MDTITLARIELLHPKVRAEARDIYAAIERSLTNSRAKVRFTHTLRTIAEQDALYAQGRTAPGKIVTNAKGGKSYHNYGLAIDICLIIDGKEASWDTTKDFDKDGISDWMEIVTIFKSRGWEWGGDFVSIKDTPHFQKTFGYTTAKLKSMIKGSGYPAPL